MKYESDIAKMEVALEQAKLAYKNDEIPVGAALFNDCLLYTSDAADE